VKTYSSVPVCGERLEVAQCPVCEHLDSRTVWVFDTSVFVRCRVCGHIFQNPRPDPSALGRRYDTAYTQYEIENADSFLHLMLLGLRDIGFDSIEMALGVDRRFLDVGCATGALVEALGARGWQAEGVELCEPSARWGRENRGVTIHGGTLESVAFPDRLFDLVHSSHVIEHVPNPGAFLRETWRILKPGGWCVCVTPNTASFQASVFGPAWRSAIADHVHLFSLTGLKRLMQNSGLEPVRHKTWGGLARGAGFVLFKPVVDRLAKRTGLGDVMVVLARKPC